jgi:molecular chaperone HtpG
VAEKLDKMFRDDRKAFEEKWNNIEVFIKYGMMTDEKFYEASKKYFLLGDVNGNFYTLDEYKTLIEGNQTDRNGDVINLYANDKTAQYAYIQGAEEKGYSVLLLSGQLDQHLVQFLEQKNEKTRFVRVDGDTPERLIVKEDEKKADLTPLQADLLTGIFRSQMPTLDKTTFTVEYNALQEGDAPAVITQNEMMRRMKEMAAMQQGMNFYGEMPDMYTLVVNAEQPAVKKVVTDAEAALKEKLEPIRSNIAATDKEIADLRKELDDKKEDAEKEPLRNQISDKERDLTKLHNEEQDVMKAYAAEQPVVKQVIDLALLQSGLLKGEQLAEFIRRSVTLL